MNSLNLLEVKEKLFQSSVEKGLKILDIPFLKIQFYCGNIFNVECPKCKEKITVKCNKTLNKHLSGYGDLLGIAWAMEFKRAKSDDFNVKKTYLKKNQKRFKEQMEKNKIPYLLVRQDNQKELQIFLKTIYPEKFL